MDWVRATLALVVTIAISEEAVHLHRGEPKPVITAIVWGLVIALVVVGSFAVRWGAQCLGKLVTAQSDIAAGAVVRLVATGVGSVIVILGVFAVFGLSVQHLLIGAGLAGILLGIAAQQSLSNVFASLVLLVARPFRVGEDVVIRSGALGVLEGQVRGIGLTYVTLRTAEGIIRVPNSVMLASGIGKKSPPEANITGG